jgi:flagellar protein FlgJ
MNTVNTYNELSAYRDLAVSQGLKQRAEESADDLEKVARQFESLFVNMMLKSMRAANQVWAEDNYLNTFETRMYQDMLDEQISISIADTQSIGLADLMMMQLDKSRHSVLRPGVELPASSPVRKAAFTSPEDFFSTLRPLADREARRMDVDPKFLLAQAALETGWGKSVVQSPVTGNSHNVFGIKADSDWGGERIVIDSLEVEQGVARQVRSPFRAYASYADSFRDYADFVMGDARYRDVAGSGTDDVAFARGLAKGGYATDPEYADKILRVLRSDLFTENWAMLDSVRD